MKKIAVLAVVCMTAFAAAAYAQGNKPMDLSADTVEYNTESGMLVANGSVRLLQENGIMTCQRAEYNSKTEASHLFGGVHVVKEDMQMDGAEAISDGKDMMTVIGNAYIRKQDRTIQGPRIDYNQTTNYAVVPTNAMMTMKDSVLTSNRIEAFMTDNRVIATGNVHIVNPSRKMDATSNQAVYEEKDNDKVVLTGNAVVVQEGNTLRGNRLTIFLNEGQNK